MSERTKLDPQFFDRADSFIHVANEHCDTISRGKVSASFLYGCSRFNSWLVASTHESAESMKQDREHAITYFLAEYKKMLEENLDDYITNFDRYMRPGPPTT